MGEEGTEGHRGGIWIFNCDPDLIIRVSGFNGLKPESSSRRTSTIPRLTPLDPSLCWVSGSGILGVPESDRNEFLKLSRMEVGLITASKLSEKAFREANPVNNFGNDVDFLFFVPAGDEKLTPFSAIFQDQLKCAKSKFTGDSRTLDKK